MDNTESAWNFWFPGQTGIYYTVVDTKAKEFKPTYIKAMQLNGEDMTYDAPNYAWTKVIQPLLIIHLSVLLLLVQSTARQPQLMMLQP